MQTGTSQLHATWSSTDSASGICEYQYAIGTQATDPGSGYVVGWTSAGTNTEANESGLSLQYGSIYYWYVKARDCAGNWSETATSDGIAIVQSVSGSVRAAKLLEDGASVGLTSKAVSAVLDDAFYIQDSDAPMGIRVQADSTPAGLAAGDVVDVGGGLLTNSDGERYIQACVWDTSADYAVIPIGMNNEWLGGSDWYYADMTGAGQQGIEDAVGLNNVGLLVRTWGKVVSVVQGQPEDTNQIQSWDFNANPGWTLQGQWAHGTPTGGGSDCGDPTSGYTGTSVVGYNLAGEYPNSMSTTYYATTPAIDCSTCTGVELQFRRWLGVESSAYDHANIQVSNNGSNWTTVWSNTAADMCDGAWTLQTYDLSAIADQQPTVYIRWGMGPTDSTVTYPGWNIDDVVISGLQSHMVTIDDGSGVDVFVVYPQNAELPEVGAYVTITGISSCIRDDQDRVQRLVRALTTP